jgi:hypothetical protein
LESHRLTIMNPQSVGQTQGIFPTAFAKVAKEMGPRGLPGPDIILLWPSWELGTNGRLSALLPALYSRFTSDGEQLSFCLSHWIGGGDNEDESRKLWAFLPLESLCLGYTVTFDEKNGSAIQEPEEEERIWAYGGVRIVFYKTRKNGSSYRTEMDEVLQRVQIHQSLSDRPDQKMLKKWMKQAVCRTEEMSSLEPYPFPPFRPKRSVVTVRVENTAVTQTYVIPGDHVYVVSFDV